MDACVALMRSQGLLEAKALVLEDASVSALTPWLKTRSSRCSHCHRSMLCNLQQPPAHTRLPGARACVLCARVCMHLASKSWHAYCGAGARPVGSIVGYDDDDDGMTIHIAAHLDCSHPAPLVA